MKKIIVVGGGRWGTNHIRTLIQLNCFGGVVEPYPKSQERLRSQFPDIIIFNDIAESLKSNPDGYTVATPPETHFDIGCEVINNHKPNYSISEYIQLQNKRMGNDYYDYTS